MEGGQGAVDIDDGTGGGGGGQNKSIGRNVLTGLWAEI